MAEFISLDRLDRVADFRVFDPDESVLIIANGAFFNPTFKMENRSRPSLSHEPSNQPRPNDRAAGTRGAMSGQGVIRLMKVVTMTLFDLGKMME